MKNIRSLINLTIILIVLISTLFFPPTLGKIHLDSEKVTFFESNEEKSSWTYMAYWIGDMKGNHPGAGTLDFDYNIIDTINMMELSGSNSEVNIVMQADDYDMWGGDKGQLGGTRRYHIQHDENPDEFADYSLGENVWYLEEQNMGDPNTLKDFINWSVTNFPADHYILALHGHGEGWIQICQDHSSGLLPPFNYANPSTSMSIVKDLKDALSTCPHLDILFFFACHMGQMEVFHQFKDYADIIIATQSNMGGSINMFKDPIENLTINPDITAIELSQIIVDNYNPALIYPFDKWSPLFAIQSKYVNNITQSFNNLTDELLKQYHRNPFKIKKIIIKSLEHSTMDTAPDANTYSPHAHDLYEFSEEICNLTKDTWPKIYTTALKVLSSIENSFVIEPSENANESYHGYAVFSPPRTKTNLRLYYIGYMWLEIIPRNRYKSLDFAKDTRWDEILDLIYPLRRVILKIFNLD